MLSIQEILNINSYNLMSEKIICFYINFLSQKLLTANVDLTLPVNSNLEHTADWITIKNYEENATAFSKKEEMLIKKILAPLHHLNDIHWCRDEADINHFKFSYTYATTRFEVLYLIAFVLIENYIKATKLDSYERSTLTLEFMDTSLSQQNIQEFLYIYVMNDYTPFIQNMNISWHIHKEFNLELNFGTCINYHLQQGDMSKNYTAKEKYQECLKVFQLNTLCYVYLYVTNKIDTTISNYKHIKDFNLGVIKNITPEGLLVRLLKKSDFVETEQRSLQVLKQEMLLRGDEGVILDESSCITVEEKFISYDELGVEGKALKEKVWIHTSGPINDPADRIEIINGKEYNISPLEHFYSLCKDRKFTFNEQEFYDKLLKHELQKNGKTIPTYCELKHLPFEMN